MHCRFNGRPERFRRNQLPWSTESATFLAAIVCLSFLLSVSHATDNVYRYNICNGLSNQLLYHAASIAIAKEQNKPVEIPDHFIVNGVQTSDDSVLPTTQNSVPFGVAFDGAYFLRSLQELGIRATFVTFDLTHRRPIPCAGMQSLQNADPDTVRSILQAFRPSAQIRKLIAGITEAMESRGIDQGICLHHRDGQDWYNHCARWSSIPDGIYRGNCLGVPGRSFVESLEDRGLQPGKWVYYCGDHEIPRELSSPKSPYEVVTRSDLMEASDIEAIGNIKAGSQVRDLWALIDFYVCSGLPRFIGNSVSTFSAIQIAVRQSENSFWYNSQSIPLGDIWHAFEVPIVYTYTELSQASGKHLLQVSIASVRKQMPHSKIHILYHGREDKAFRMWLARQGVHIHQHDPEWRGQIEAMRKNGDPNASHLFLHSGNYFGTWQRIDIPKFIDSEYCLLLDADTIVLKPFTLAEFGLDLTYGIAMSSEFVPDGRAVNAGVMLLNIPRLRQTYQDFLEFILQHVSSAKFNAPSPSDQGAYMDFYRNDLRFMPHVFNFKPYWKLADVEYEAPVVLHFHGAKPHDYLKRIMGDDCDAALRGLCGQVMRFPFLCDAMQNFAQLSVSIDPVAYCHASFKDHPKAVYCSEIMHTLAERQQMCYDFAFLLEFALNRVPDELGLPKERILRNIRKSMGSYLPPLPIMLVIVASVAVTFAAWRYRHRRKHSRKVDHIF